VSYVRLFAGLIVGMVSISFVAELIEFITVQSVSGMSFEELQSNQSRYFEIRNGTAILVFKGFYSLLAAIIGGYLAAWIGGVHQRVAAYLVMGVQTISVVWAGFFSDLSASGPTWMWICLLVILPLGVWIGLQLRERKHPLRTAI